MVHDSEIAVPGYILYRLDRLGKIVGGICIFVKEFYKVKPSDKLSSISNAGFHQLWLSVQIQKHKSYFICTAYRLPDCTLDCFDGEFAESFISASTLKKDIYILGDLNCNVINSSDSGAKALSDFCLSFNLKQLISQPTRITESSTTLIHVGQNTVRKIHTMINNSSCDKNSIPFVPIVSEVTQEEVEQIITKMPLGKAPGPDKIYLKSSRTVFQ